MFQKLSTFPSLFSVLPLLKDLNQQHALYLLEQEETELVVDQFPYHLETVRCNNIIIFLLYFLGYKPKALERCITVNENKSIIFLTLKATLQLDSGLHADCEKTIELLEDLYKAPDYEYLCAVAESEKGYLLIRIGPKGFIAAMDCFRNAIDSCPGSDIFLWKYDLALVIRRFFNLYVYSEHPKHSPSGLAGEALNLLQETAQNCPNKVYQARGLVELARLAQHIRSFIDVCKEKDKAEIDSQFKNINELFLIEKALTTDRGNEDYYVLRECGRMFMYARNYKKAISCFQGSEKIRRTSILYHLWGKTYLYMFTQHIEFINPKKREEDNVEAPAFSGPGISKISSSDMGSNQMKPTEPLCCWFNCLPGECPITTSRKEAERLCEEFDETPFMTEDGAFKTTQPCGVGVFRQLSDNLCTKTQLNSGIDNDNEEARLLREFEDSLYLSDDGNFKTTQESGVGNIQQPPKLHEQSKYKSRERKLNKARSFPPEANRHPARGAQPNIYKPSVKHLLKVRQPFPLDEFDLRVQTGLQFYMEAERLNQQNFTLLYDMGILYEGIKQINNAIKQYQKIILGRHSGNLILVVNALERCGLAFLELSEASSDTDEKEKLKKQAEDMFMKSLVLCRQAVAHLPKVDASRAKLWTSYTKLLDIISQTEGNVRKLRKEAEVHELVGRYLAAIEVFQKVLELACTDNDRTEAIIGCLKNYLSLGKVTEAKFILDLFLTSDQRDIILASKDNDQMKYLRELSVQVYTRTGRQALESGDLQEACLAFRTALLVMQQIKDRTQDISPEGFAPQDFDISIFSDDGDCGNDQTEKMAETCGKIFKDLFGMRVSVNEQHVLPGHLTFDGELQMAESTHLVLLVISNARELSPRMTCIRDIVLQTHREGKVLVVAIEAFGIAPQHDFHHSFLHAVPKYPGNKLLGLTGENFVENVDVCCSFFNFVLAPGNIS